MTQSNTTPYEGNLDLDISDGGGGIAVTLATAQGFGGQSSKLSVPGGVARGHFEVLEQDYGALVTCPAGFECLGQKVTTIATGLAPVNLQITYEGSTSGLNENGLVVFHQPNTGPVVEIDEKCSGAIFSGPPPASEIPCRRVDIDHNDDIILVDAWDSSNGQWGFG